MTPDDARRCDAQEDRKVLWESFLSRDRDRRAEDRARPRPIIEPRLSPIREPEFKLPVTEYQPMIHGHDEKFQIRAGRSEGGRFIKHNF